MVKVYLSLGSNIGDKSKNLNKAISLLKAHPYIKDIRTSSFYKTAPQGYIDQDYFVNSVVSLRTELDAFEILKICHEVEQKLKRVRLFRWGPRVIDVDILLYGDEKINTKDLTIPHPRMYERAFVLVPLCELNSAYLDHLKKLDDQDVKKIIN